MNKRNNWACMDRYVGADSVPEANSSTLAKAAGFTALSSEANVIAYSILVSPDGSVGISDQPSHMQASLENPAA